MFGYKLFSLYFPLFLVAKGFSLPKIGFNYLLIYLPIALFAPVAGILTKRVNSGILAAFGILGYGFYSLGMILIENPILFYFWQVLLGVSAALFFVSTRTILMRSPLESFDRSFGWFYSSPFYADAFAPVVGAFLIWKFNFFGVFFFSFALHFLNAIFCFSYLRKNSLAQTTPKESFNFRKNYQSILEQIKSKTILPFLLVSFSILILAGFYRAFFVLFLKNLEWSQNQILVFASVLSLIFLPISLLVIKKLGKQKSEKNILEGSFVYGCFTILFGILVPFLNFCLVLILAIGKSVGGLMASSGRSGLLSQKLKETPAEAGAIDTIFSPLGVAIGSLAAGFLIGILDYQGLFIFGGIFVLIAVAFGKLSSDRLRKMSVKT
jgi:MFS family permease